MPVSVEAILKILYKQIKINKKSTLSIFKSVNLDDSSCTAQSSVQSDTL